MIDRTLPYRCDDKDCAIGWHREQYWEDPVDGSLHHTDEDGKAFDEDADEIANSWPTEDDADKAWFEYYAYVIESGEDPLKEFTDIPYTKTKTQKFVAKFKYAEGASTNRTTLLLPQLERLQLERLWCDGKQLSLDTDPPKEVMDYLHLERPAGYPTHRLRTTMPCAELRDIPGAELSCNRITFKFSLDIKKPTPASVWKRVLRQEANKAIELLGRSPDGSTST